MNTNSLAQAFPGEVHNGSGEIIGGGPGLSKREYAAVQIMAGMCAGQFVGNSAEVSELAVARADALFAELDKTHNAELDAVLTEANTRYCPHCERCWELCACNDHR